ncbi:MAG TPA: cation diffusion facilitator family transporter [Oceanipulchritudo sp.]|nr:cation diffusion facilitator family transporter [Oceanipulchritudo sp.]
MSSNPESIGAFSFIANISLAGVKIMVGTVGSSYALIADGIESLADCVSSLIVWNGLRVASKKADHDHPYGHGKAEAVAALLAGMGLVISAIIIAWNAIVEIFSPQLPPALFTLPALIGIILAKESLFRFTSKGARSHNSNALRAEAWHHRSDSLTSLGVLVGILIAVIGGPKYAYVDDLAACLVTVLILYNGFKIIRPALDELMDRRIEDDNHQIILAKIRDVSGVEEVETLIVRRSGRDYLVDVHIEVEPSISVKQGHAIAHSVKDHLLELESPRISHVTTHVEPHGKSRVEPVLN